MSGTPFARRPLSVLANEALGPYHLLRVADPDGPEPMPGQFAMLAAAERWGGGEDERPYLPRACSIARQAGPESQYLLEDVGPGTRRLCALEPGELLWTLGPLGAGFRLAPAERSRAILVGGGVGIAPLAILSDALPEPATVLLGFRDEPRTLAGRLFDSPLLATDDGSAGYHGAVTDLLEDELDRESRSVVYACGPPGMLERIRAICARRGTPCQLALEAGMACGFGACFGCAVPRRGGGYLRVCLDGPVIDGDELDLIDAHAGAPA